MKLKKNLIFVALLNVFGMNAGTFIPLTNKEIDTEDLQKIAFEGDTVNVFMKDGKSQTFDFSSMQRIYFTDASSDNVTTVETLESATNAVLYVYPNPVTDIIYVKGVEGVYYVADLKGKVFKQGTIDTTNNSIEISNIQKGEYVFRVADKFVRFIKK